MMPKLDGFEVLKRLRSEGCRTPILLLTAKTEVEARIQGLNLGADDYLPKPFDMGELLALRLMVPREDMAKAITTRFQETPEKLYGSLLALLLQDEEG